MYGEELRALGESSTLGAGTFHAEMFAAGTFDTGTMDGLRTLLLALGVLAGASSQRVTGLGFALVSAPLLVLAAGAYDGVLLANLLSVAVSVSVLATTWRDAEWRRGLLLSLPALATVPLGAWTARALPEAVMTTVIGVLTVAALALVAFRPLLRLPRDPYGAVAAGSASGFMNAAAGVGGPALVVYAMSRRWQHARFVATSQVCFLSANAASVTAKGFPRIPAWDLTVSFAALAAGVLLGHLLAGRIPAAAARRAVLALALAGSSLAVVRGVLLW